MKNNRTLPTSRHASTFMPQGLYAQEILSERARLLAVKITVTDTKKEIINFIRFCLAGNQYFGISFTHAKEVLNDTKITFLPLAPGFIGGVMNYRGKFIPVIDLAKLFSLPAVNTPTVQAVIVIDVAGRLVGILADSIEGSVNCDANQLDAPLTTRSLIKTNYVNGLYQGATALLNIENIYQDCLRVMQTYSKQQGV